MYATGANSTAADGTGRNGVFTGYLLENLKNPALSVFDVFDRTMDAVIKGTNGRQNPELSLRFAGATSAYLGPRPSPAPSPTPTPIQTYKIGDTGPAGGIVFYDKGRVSDGWRYLEAAPVETEFKAPWGGFEKDVSGTGTAVGSGKRNTQVIVEQLRAFGESGKAAQLCASLTFDGYSDWFLPSIDELDLMYKNLASKGLGGFNGLYWSSSQNNTNDAWRQSLSYQFGGNQHGWPRSGTNSVRAVRAF
jgi:hypothetical protein